MTIAANGGFEPKAVIAGRWAACSGRHRDVAQEALCWVFIRVFKSRSAANARRFLRDLERACPIRIRTVLTDNGKPPCRAPHEALMRMTRSKPIGRRRQLLE